MIEELKKQLNDQALKLIKWNNENINSGTIHQVRENITITIHILEAIR